MVPRDCVAAMDGRGEAAAIGMGAREHRQALLETPVRSETPDRSEIPVRSFPSTSGSALRGTILLLACFVSVIHLPLARASSVLVRDGDDRPVANVLVSCEGREEGAGLTGPDGIATVPDACRRVSCARGGFVSGSAELVDGRALCRVVRGIWVVLEGTVSDVAHAERNQETMFCEDCYASLVRVDAERGVGSRLNVRGNSWTARLGPVAPGAYTLAVERLVDRMISAPNSGPAGKGPAGNAPADTGPAGRDADAFEQALRAEGWTCRTAITISDADEQHARGVWREPRALRGVVHLADGRPAFDVPVRVRPAAPPLLQEGAWRCESPADAPDAFTSRDGAFTLWVDPGASVEIEAGSSWDPDGHAVLEVPAGATEIVELRLTR